MNLLHDIKEFNNAFIEELLRGHINEVKISTQAFFRDWYTSRIARYTPNISDKYLSAFEKGEYEYLYPPSNGYNLIQFNEDKDIYRMFNIKSKSISFDIDKLNGNQEDIRKFLLSDAFHLFDYFIMGKNADGEVEPYRDYVVLQQPTVFFEIKCWFVNVFVYAVYAEKTDLMRIK